MERLNAPTSFVYVFSLDDLLNLLSSLGSDRDLRCSVFCQACNSRSFDALVRAEASRIYDHLYLHRSLTSAGQRLGICCCQQHRLTCGSSKAMENSVAIGDQQDVAPKTSSEPVFAACSAFVSNTVREALGNLTNLRPTQLCQIGAVQQSSPEWVGSVSIQVADAVTQRLLTCLQAAHVAQQALLQGQQQLINQQMLSQQLHQRLVHQHALMLQHNAGQQALSQPSARLQAPSSSASLPTGSHGSQLTPPVSAQVLLPAPASTLEQSSLHAAAPLTAPLTAPVMIPVAASVTAPVSQPSTAHATSVPQGSQHPAQQAVPGGSAPSAPEASAQQTATEALAQPAPGTLATASGLSAPTAASPVAKTSLVAQQRGNPVASGSTVAQPNGNPVAGISPVAQQTGNPIATADAAAQQTGNPRPMTLGQILDRACSISSQAFRSSQWEKKVCS